jgi:cytidylate kinase
MARGIEQIVNERVLKWNAERRATPPPHSSVRKVVVAQRPMVTISRECGSLGGELGRKVARSLGFTFYSQELVHEIATAAHVQSQSVASLDEQSKGAFEVMMREILDGEAFAARDYLHYLRGVLRAVGRNGRGVVIGRGSHLILDPACTLRVRTYAGLDRRIQNLAERHDIGRPEATTMAGRVDRERAAFHREHFNVDWSDRALFDLCLNTSTLMLDQCSEIVVAAYRARFGAEER